MKSILDLFVVDGQGRLELMLLLLEGSHNLNNNNLVCTPKCNIQYYVLNLLDLSQGITPNHAIYPYTQYAQACER